MANNNSVIPEHGQESVDLEGMMSHVQAVMQRFNSEVVTPGLGAKADKPTYSPVYEAVASPTGNPSELGYYEIVSNEYVLSQDTTVDSEKTYYIQKSYYKMTI